MRWNVRGRFFVLLVVMRPYITRHIFLNDCDIIMTRIIHFYDHLVSQNFLWGSRIQTISWASYHLNTCHMGSYLDSPSPNYVYYVHASLFYFKSKGRRADLILDFFSFSSVLWHINHCRLFNVRSAFIHINDSISNNSVLLKYILCLYTAKCKNSTIPNNSA